MEYHPSVQSCKINGTVDKNDNLSSVSLEFNSIYPDACRNYSKSMLERFINEPGSVTLIDMMTIPAYSVFGQEILYFTHKDTDSGEESISDDDVFEIMSKSQNSPQILNGWEYSTVIGTDTITFNAKYVGKNE